MSNLNNRKKIILIIILVFLGIGGYYMYNYFTYENIEETIMENEILSFCNEIDLNNTKEENTNKIIVHITGEVVKPGIIELEEGERVYNAIEKAGGVTKNADTSKINLAAIVEDGIKINVPNVNDKTEDVSNIEMTRETDETAEKMVNINTATQTELESLPGIGPSLAMKIINYRKEKGKFSKTEDIKNVSGIGESKYENIKSLIKVK